MYCLGLFVVLCIFPIVTLSSNRNPNVVVLFADDVGYGDLGCYGHPTSSTPNLDKLASDGLLFTQFYVGSPVCSPSRASLLTGRLPPRTGVYPGVFQANCTGGLPLNETTIAKMLKQQGYQTGMIGKWHLGVGKNHKYLPTNFGFDYYFGIPYTHAQCPCITCFWPDAPCFIPCKPYFTGCPLYYNTEIIDQPVDLLTLNERYATAARNFIATKSKEKNPFFLYYAFQHCHAPQFAGKQFRNSTLRGVFGDSLAEVDWSVGQVLEELHNQGIAENTLVFFSSDNGPSTVNEVRGGAAGLLKCGKGTTYEGGQRVPAIAYWPGRIKSGKRTPELASTLDLLPTLAKLVGAPLPNVTLDGMDMSPVLFEEGKSQRDTFFYYYEKPEKEIGVYAVRYQQYKAHYYTQGAPMCGAQYPDKDCRPSANLIRHDPPLLYDLHLDPSEQYNLSFLPQYKELLDTIWQIYIQHVETMDWAESEILRPVDKYVEPCCTPGCSPFPSCCQCHRSLYGSSLFISLAAQSPSPNIVILFADDLGYGDLSCYGHPTSQTPNIDNLFNNGLHFTQFYTANPLCSPSRASLLTGRLPPRLGVWPGVFLPESTGGLPHNETTLAQILKTKGYSTSIVGKWHLGVGKNNEYSPIHYGFDSYYGIPYSQDFCPCLKCFYPDDPCFNQCDLYYPGCPLYKDDKIIEQPTDFTVLEEKYIQQATTFISTNAAKKTPFFLYYAFNHVHHPQFASKQFRNSTSRGTFGDSLAELDYGIGHVIQQLRDSGVENNTLILFTSDNGPSLRNENRGGNAGPLKCGKGTTYEGGQRVPAIAYWPGRVKPGRTMELASTLDFLPTIANLVNATLPNVTLDGVDIGPLLFQQEKSKRDTFFYIFAYADPLYPIYAVRHKHYKAHYFTEGSDNCDFTHDLDCRPTAKRTAHFPPLLYDLNTDPSEVYNLNTDPAYSAILKKIDDIRMKFEAELVWAPSEINKRSDPNVEPCCNPGCSPFPSCCQCM
ncbi:uncharacterized protein LOC144444838 [Glandiceps talaboti]